MAEGGKDIETTDDIFKNIYSLTQQYTNTETTFTNPMSDDNTQYNSSDNSSLSSNVNFDDIEKGSAFLRGEITKMDTGQDASVKYEERMKVLRNPSLVENSNWKFTQTNLRRLADLVFTAEEVNDEQIDELHPNIKTGNYLLSGPNETTLYMIGENRSGDNTWVRITDKNGKLLKKSTIEGFEGGKRVEEKISSLSHHYLSTGKYAELKQQLENEAAAREERRIEATAWLYTKQTGKETGEQIELQIRKPTPQKSNLVSQIEDVINSDVESISSDIFNSIVSNETDNELRETFGEYDAREISGFKIAEKKMAETRGQLISKIALLDEQVGQETDPAKKKEIQEALYVKKLNLKYLNDEYDSQKQRKKIWIDYIKKPDSQIPLKDRLKLLFKLEGFTIAAVIAAITMFFTTIGLAISNSLRGKGGGSGGGGSDKPPSIPDRVREGLKKFAEWLIELAKKSAAALPGFIGSIVVFLLKFAAAAVGFLAEHLIILIFMVVSSLIYGLIEGVKTIKKSTNKKTIKKHLNKWLLVKF